MQSEWSAPPPSPSLSTLYTLIKFASILIPLTSRKSQKLSIFKIITINPRYIFLFLNLDLLQRLLEMQNMAALLKFFF